MSDTPPKRHPCRKRLRFAVRSDADGTAPPSSSRPPQRGPWQTLIAGEPATPYRENRSQPRGRDFGPIRVACRSQSARRAPQMASEDRPRSSALAVRVSLCPVPGYLHGKHDTP